MWVSNVDGEYYADDPRDFCPHGVYVGGCGYDYMCWYCEMDVPWDEYVAYCTEIKTQRVRQRAETVQNILHAMLEAGISGIDALERLDRYFPHH